MNAGSIAAKLATTGFGLENLPYSSFTPPAGQGTRLGVRIGDHVLDVRAAVERYKNTAADTVSADLAKAVEGPNLDALLAADRTVWDALRELLTRLLNDPDAAADLEPDVYPLAGVQLHMPFTIADYVDFYASEHHASNVGQIFRPEQAPLTPNWKHLPIGYHGRAGTIVPSGTDVIRPKGLRPEPGAPPSFGPSRRLDIEAELGFVLGSSAPAGEVALADAREHIFGVTLVNDWSARDIQAFEYVPLGPFLGKSFATSIGHWVVPIAALDAARVGPPERSHQLTSYLDDASTEPWGLNISMEVQLDGQTISHPPVALMYWTGAQMLTHMTANGAAQRPGDFFASGTVSGPEADQRGSFLELSWSGTTPLRMDNGKEVSFLEDGHEIVISATAPGPNGSVISLGEVAGKIVPAT
ncbi:fumarylacetoacetate hydrolase [Arthrobacter sp. PAMC 25486]|nr:fumarylacetoacetate hydrolase [Arthrobacter sp. PAMC 25486]